MIDYAYYNGIITPYDCATVPLSDRAIFFGDAVYDVILGHNGIPYQLSEHLSRLIGNAQAIGLSSIPTLQEITEAIDKTIMESHADDFMLYVQLSADKRRRDHSRADSKTNLLITLTAADIPDKLYYTSATLQPDFRHGYCKVKTTDLLPSVLSVRDAQSRGSDIAIFHKEGIVTEASHANVSLIMGNTLITHPLDSSILPGISQLNLIDVSLSLGLSHEERCFTLRELSDADIILITSTTKLVRVCNKLGDIIVECKNLVLAEVIFDLMRRDLLSKTTARHSFSAENSQEC